MTRISIRKNDMRRLYCGLVLAAAGFACNVNELGKIPCNDTSNCPSDYPTCSAGGFCVNSAPAAQIVVVSGDAQTAVVGTALSQSLVVKVLDTNGNAVPNITVSWSLGTGAGQVSAGSTTSGPDGKTSITASVGNIAGANTFSAAGTGLTGTSFTATGIAASAVTLAVTGFSNAVTAGTAGTVTVTARDTFGNTAIGYLGTVHVATDNPNATLPADHTFTAGDGGVHVFPVTLMGAADPQIATFSITATDTVTATITGRQAGITVNPDVAVTLQVVGFPTSVTAGIGGFVVVTALDAFGNTAIGYQGTVHMTSSDGSAALPANHTYTVTDAGVHTFSVTLKTAAPSASIIATDTGTMTITGRQTGILVNPGATTMLVVTGFPNPASADTGGSVTVTAQDANGNTTPAYLGIVQVTSDNPNSTLPMTHPFIAGGNGVFTFTGVVLKKASSPSYEIRATDTVIATITGRQTGIVVNPGATAGLLVTGFPNPASADTGGSVTVTAADANGNTTPGYLGTVHFTSDNPNKTLPADYTFVGGDNGVFTFTGVVLKKASSPSYEIRATDTVIATITGRQTGIVVNPGATAQLQVAGFPSTVFAGTPGSVTVTAQDANNNTTPLYAGTVQIISSDTAATDATATLLPLNYTFTVLDAGVHAFTIILNTTSGATSITASDGTLTGMQNAIVVNAGPIVFGATATVISGGSRDGLIFIAGGSVSISTVSPLSNTWFYNPADSTLTPGPTLAFARYTHTATAIGVGQVLIAGGSPGASGSFREFELCSLAGATPSCAATGGTLNTARCNAAAALVSATQVLIAGGDNCSTATAFTSWDLWDSGNASMPVSSTGSNKLAVGRRFLTATAVAAGVVLLAGGNATSATADIFTLNSGTPDSSTVLPTSGNPTAARLGHSATLLTSTTATTACPNAATASCVLLAGGNPNTGKTWEIYDASTDSFPRNAATGGPPNHDLVLLSRQFHSAVAFANGKVLLAGGTNGASAQSTTEVFDPTATTLSFTSGLGLQVARFKTAAAYAPAQDVLVLVGGNAGGPSTEQVTAP